MSSKQQMQDAQDNNATQAKQVRDIMDYLSEMSDEEKYAYYLTIAENDSLGLYGAAYLHRDAADAEK